MSTLQREHKTPDDILATLNEIAADTDDKLEMSSTQFLADFARVVGDEADTDATARFFNSLTHDQCMAFTSVIKASMEIGAMVLWLVAQRHFEVCPKQGAHLN